MAYTNWLGTAKNLEELKTLYRQLARQHHPDLGGSTATMQEINTEYEMRVKLFEAGFVPINAMPHARPKRETQGDPATEWGRMGISREAWEAYRAVNEMRKTAPYPWGLTVEVVRGRVRVGGKASYHYSDHLKALGFRWDSEKRYWFFVKKPSGAKKAG